MRPTNATAWATLIVPLDNDRFFRNPGRATPPAVFPDRLGGSVAAPTRQHSRNGRPVRWGWLRRRNGKLPITTLLPVRPVAVRCISRHAPAVGRSLRE